MECGEAKTQLTGLVSGRLDESTASEVEAHLETCEECSLEVELLRGRNAPAPAPGRTNDWTVEKIFGSDDAGSKSSSTGKGEGRGTGSDPGERLEVSRTDTPLFASDDLDTPPSRDEAKTSGMDAVSGGAAPAPSRPPAASDSTERPSMILPPPATKKGSGENWDFEPADATRESAPPEESLAFAEQALQRRNERSGKQSAAVRATLWGGSAVAGVALLGVSIWMALAVQQAPNQVVSTKSPRLETGDRRPMPAAGPRDSTGVGHASSRTPAPAAPVPDGGASRATTPVPTSAPPAAGAPTVGGAPIRSGLGSTPPRVVTPAAPPEIAPAKPLPGKPAATNPGASSPSSAPQAVKPVPAPPPATKAPAVVSKDGGSASSTTPAAPPRLPRDDDDMWPTDDPIRHAPVPSKPVPPAAPKDEPGVEKPPAAGATTAKPAPAPDTSSPGTAPPPAALKPIDRLHAATVTATQNDDLDGLRRLKTAWRSTLRTAVGPNRARARRELADCLWAIQALTGRETDQREALVAYRDYLLNAPAGGTDTQGAERLRELEDTLRER